MRPFDGLSDFAGSPGGMGSATTALCVDMPDPICLRVSVSVSVSDGFLSGFSLQLTRFQRSHARKKKTIWSCPALCAIGDELLASGKTIRYNHGLVRPTSISFRCVEQTITKHARHIEL